MYNEFLNSLANLKILSLLAYLGPGMGGGIIAAIFGVLAAFFLALWGILYYPIKRYFKNKKIRSQDAKIASKHRAK